MRYVYYNPNPFGRSVGDCAVRAISKAMRQSWEKTYAWLCLEGFARGDLPNADSVWGSYLARHGFARHLMPDDCSGCCTVSAFASEHPQGTFILSMPGQHVVTVIDGKYFDSWESGNECPTCYWSRPENTDC